MGKKLMKQHPKQEETERKCFVPSCTNKKDVNAKEKRQRVQFFQVPDGIEGLFWEKAVKIRQRKYDKMIDLLSSTDYMLGLDDVNNTSPKRYEYCCEVHFDIDADIERIVNDNGNVEYKVKPGAVPQIKPKQTKRLYDDIEEDCDIMNNDIIKVEKIMTDAEAQSNNFQECSKKATTNGYVSIVDISTLTNQNTNGHTSKHVNFVNYEVSPPVEQQWEINYEPIMPMLPLTTAMMKRKSPYYMGLQQNQFLQLLQLAHQKQLSDVKVMITLRKLRWNEEFEALGDLFDLDKTTTEHYFDESKHDVINLVDVLCTTAPNTNHIDSSAVSAVVIKYEECPTIEALDPILLPINENNATNTMRTDIDDDQFSTKSSESSESSSSYVPSESDPDVMSDDLYTDSDESLYAEKTEECSLCNQSCTPRGLQIHLQTHSLRLNLNKTTCGLCLQMFETNLLLQSHQRKTHDGNAYGCDICNKQVREKRQLDMHILTTHAKVKTYLCDLCGEGFPYKGTLNFHLKRKHWNARNHKCNLCDMKYFTTIALEDHIRAIHTQKRPFKCKIEGCAKTFSRHSVYRSHSRVHALDKFECNICSKQFSFKGNLTAHKKNIHGMMV